MRFGALGELNLFPEFRTTIAQADAIQRTNSNDDTPKMTEIQDYAGVDIPDPDEKPYMEWHYTERRAYLLQKALKRGSPKKINQSREAERFGKANSTIHDDFEAIGESLEEHLADDILFQTKAVFQKVTNDLLAEEDWRAKREAFKTAMEWSEFLVDRGMLEKAPEQHEIRQLDDSETDDYKIVESKDEAIDAEYSVVGDDDEEAPEYEPKPIPDMDDDL